ncbi:hypothetical protein O9X98_14605 [Agrobacterium salinitolerans]|nr:hypothetical protein [Agrobacterium salinitolerans]
MPKVKFVLLDENGEQVQTPMKFDVEAVPQRGNVVGLFDRNAVVEQVEHRYGVSKFRGGQVEQEITVTLRATQ